MIKAGIATLIFCIFSVSITGAEKRVKMTPVPKVNNLEEERNEFILRGIFTEGDPFLPEGLTLSEKEELDEGMKNYNEKNYEEAARVFRGMLNNSASDKLQETAMYFLSESVFKSALNAGTSFEPAISLYRKAIRKFPEGENAPRSLLIMGQINIKRKFYLEARGFFMKGLKDYPESIFAPSMGLWLGTNALLQNKYKDALSFYENILKEDGRRTSFIPAGKGKRMREWINPTEKIKTAANAAFWGIGDVHFLTGNYSLARKQYEKGLAVDPKEINKYPLSLFNLAQIYYSLADYNKALEYFNEFINNYPDIGFAALALGKIGDIHGLTGDFSAAEKSYTKALNKNRKGAYSELWAKIGTASLYVRKGGKNTLSLSFAEIEEKYPELKLDDEILFKMGRFFMEKSAYPDALFSFTEISGKYPESRFFQPALEEIRKCLVILMEDDHNQGKYFEVIRSYEKNKKSFADKGDDAKLLFLVGDSYMKIGIPSKANYFYEEARRGMEGEGKNSKLILQMAQTEFSEGHMEAAKKLFSEVYQNNISNKVSLIAGRYIGYILYKGKKHTEAWSYYESWMENIIRETGKEGKAESLQKLIEGLNSDFLEADASAGTAGLRIRFIETILENKGEIPSPAQLWLILGNSYFEEKSYALAIKAFREGIILNSEAIKIDLVNYQLARSYLALNNKSEAMKVLATAGEKNILSNLGREYARTADLEKRIGQLN